MLELSRSRSANLLALAAIIGIAGAILGLYQASSNASRIDGPMALATSSTGDVYFRASDAIYHADAEGALLQVVPLARLGLDDVLADIEPDGDAILVAEGASGNIKRCRLDQGSCRQLASVTTLPTGTAIDIALAPDRSRLYVATSSLHRVDAYDLNGKHLYRLAIDGDLRFPNEIAALGNNLLMIADTNHHRVIGVEDRGDGTTALQWKIDAYNELTRPGRIWPTNAVRAADGSYWVIDTDGRLQNGDVVIYSAQGKALQRVALGDDADPVTLAPLGSDMLVADYSSFTIRRVSADGRTIGMFGDGTLRERLDVLRSTHAHWIELRTMASVAIGLFALLGFVAGILDARARKQPAPSGRRPGVVLHPAEITAAQRAAAGVRPALRADAKGVMWLSHNRAYLRKMWLLNGGVVLAAVAIAVLLFSDAAKMPRHLSFEMAGVAVALVVIVTLIVLGMSRIRLGTDGTRLHLIDILGRKAEALPAELSRTGRRLFMGRVSVPLNNRQMQLFDEEQFGAYITPVLEQVPQVSELQLLGRNLRRGDLTTWLSMLALFAIVGARIYYEFFRHP